jgi:hypothetical protein
VPRCPKVWKRVKKCGPCKQSWIWVPIPSSCTFPKSCLAHHTLLILLPFHENHVIPVLWWRSIGLTLLTSWTQEFVRINVCCATVVPAIGNDKTIKLFNLLYAYRYNSGTGSFNTTHYLILTVYVCTLLLNADKTSGDWVLSSTTSLAFLWRGGGQEQASTNDNLSVSVFMFRLRIWNPT